VIPRWVSPLQAYSIADTISLLAAPQPNKKCHHGLLHCRRLPYNGSVGFRGADTNVDGRITSLWPYGLFLSCPRRRFQ
jgi:hypothetical protein